MRRLVVVTILFCQLILSATLVSAQESGFPARYVDGIHYLTLPTPVPVEDPNKIEVVEVFWYACSHCFRLEPEVHAYEQSLAADVKLVRMPAIWQPIMNIHARIFYTAKQLGVLDTVHQGVFNAIHLDRKQLKSAEEVADLFANYGIDKDKVIKTFSSGAVTEELKNDDEKVRAYQITGTPQLIVDGRYRVEATKNLRQDDMFKVVDFLVGKVRAEKAGAQ